MLADAEVHIAARIVMVREVFFAVDECHGRGCKVGRATDELRDVGREHVQDLTARYASGHPLGIGCKGLEPCIPARREFALDDRLDLCGLGRMLFGIACKEIVPF